jgi:hypothetical protein
MSAPVGVDPVPAIALKDMVALGAHFRRRERSRECYPTRVRRLGSRRPAKMRSSAAEFLIPQVGERALNGFSLGC